MQHRAGGLPEFGAQIGCLNVGQDEGTRASSGEGERSPKPRAHAAYRMRLVLARSSTASPRPLITARSM